MAKSTSNDSIGIEVACQTEQESARPRKLKKQGWTWINRILSYLIPILLFNSIFIIFVKYFLDSNQLELWVHDKLGNYY